MGTKLAKNCGKKKVSFSDFGHYPLNCVNDNAKTKKHY